MAASALLVPPRTPLDRFLSLFADVRHGESGRLMLLVFNVFLILTAYYVMKPAREALILAQPGGAEIKSYSMALQALLLVFLVPAYGKVATWLPRRRLINSVTAFFIACLPLFYLAAEQGWPVGIPFFLWIGIFSLMVIAQFWAYANDVYTPEEGKRLFALIAFGASLGAVFGAFISGRLIGVLGVRFGAAQPLPAADRCHDPAAQLGQCHGRIHPLFDRAARRGGAGGGRRTVARR
jgi:AAA family ATP:ADP antiporter